MRATINVAIMLVSIGLGVLAGAPLSPAVAAERLGARTTGLGLSLGAASRRLERAPRASAYDLKNMRRRLAEQRVDTPRDPRLGRLDLRLRHEQWRADRVISRRQLAIEAATAPGDLPLPEYLRKSFDVDLRGSQLAIGTGKRFIFVQRGLRAAAADLEQGRVAIARERVLEAEASLSALRVDLGDQVAADDPNLVALEAEIGALKTRIADAG